jgi:hypothetical protein
VGPQRQAGVVEIPEPSRVEVVERTHQKVGANPAPERSLAVDQTGHHRDRRPAENQTNRGPGLLRRSVDGPLEKREQLRGTFEEVRKLVEDDHCGPGAAGREQAGQAAEAG